MESIEERALLLTGIAELQNQLNETESMALTLDLNERLHNLNQCLFLNCLAEMEKS